MKEKRKIMAISQGGSTPAKTETIICNMFCYVSLGACTLSNFFPPLLSN